MAELFLVRHAQAAFGTDDYDRLTELGHRQAQWLGHYFGERELSFDRVMSGTLRRHRETLEGIAAAGIGLASTRIDPGLDEYDPERLVGAHLAARHGVRDEPPPLLESETADAGSRRHHFRLLREALTDWADGHVNPPEHRTFAEFQQLAYRAFESAWQAEQSNARCVLIVSSGGPISSIIARHLEMPAASFVALNLQIRNTGICEIRFGARSAQLISLNSVPHLDTTERRRYVTYS